MPLPINTTRSILNTPKIDLKTGRTNPTKKGREEATSKKRLAHTHAHDSIIHSGQDGGTTQVSTNEWISKIWILTAFCLAMAATEVPCRDLGSPTLNMRNRAATWSEHGPRIPGWEAACQTVAQGFA